MSRPTINYEPSKMSPNPIATSLQQLLFPFFCAQDLLQHIGSIFSRIRMHRYASQSKIGTNDCCRLLYSYPKATPAQILL
jgi:hypothetical protein